MPSTPIRPRFASGSLASLTLSAAGSVSGIKDARLASALAVLGVLLGILAVWPAAWPWLRRVRLRWPFNLAPDPEVTPLDDSGKCGN